MKLIKKLGKKISLCLLAGALIGLPSIGHAKNIDEIILENAAKSQVVMFGEEHSEEGDFACGRYVELLLERLNDIGYKTLVIEVDSCRQERLEDYLNGNVGWSDLIEEIPYLKEGTQGLGQLLRKAHELGMKVYAIDERGPHYNEGPPAEMGTDRNRKMFENMKGMIFEENPETKVIAFLGASHINETAIPHRHVEGVHKMLGQFLSEYLGEDRNYTVNLSIGSPNIYKVDMDINEHPELIDSLKAYYKYYRIDKIDRFILENAEKSQTVMFGEFHYHHYVDVDNEYVKSLLPLLKRRGFYSLAVEIDSFHQPTLELYLNGKIDEHVLLRRIPYSEWIIDVLKCGKRLGMDIYAIDERTEDMHEEIHNIYPNLPQEGPFAEYGTDRNWKMFGNMKRMIFDKDPDAKVVVFVGTGHINEEPVIQPLAKSEEPQKMLGQFLSEYLGEDKNYTINLVMEMGRFKPTISKVDMDINQNDELKKGVCKHYSRRR